ncbi:MAG: hypothetical protein J5885_02670 [Clostridia bacterium]|nr:hypothetical protein [Clostridia bacterium]
MLSNKNDSRSKNAVLNIVIGYFCQIGILITTFIGRKIFLRYLSIDYLGIDGLFGNLLTVLSLAELGLDTAVLFSLYKPVADDNKPLIHSLLKFFKKIYIFLAIIIFLIGVALLPFLKYLVNSNIAIGELQYYFLIFVLNTVLSYFVAHKNALLSAYQQQRVSRIIALITKLALQIVCIVVLTLTRNYLFYLYSIVIVTIAGNLLLNFACNKLHKDVLIEQETVSFDKKPIYKRISATFIYKICTVAINNTDNILISVLVSTAAVGLYSNYLSIISAVNSFLVIITVSLVSGIGNLNAKGDAEKQYKLFNSFLLFYHFIGSVGGTGFILLFNNLISYWLGSVYVLDNYTVWMISINFYITTAITPIWMYREANGLFKEVQLLIIFRALLNLFLSIVLGILWGTFGILLATAVSLLMTSFIIEPIILFKKCFNKKVCLYWFKQLKHFMISVLGFSLSLLAISFIPNGLLYFCIKAVIILTVFIVLFTLFNIKNDDYLFFVNIFKRFFRKKEKN